MLHLKDVFLHAWSKTKPLLDSNPDERHARLARRSSACLQRPLREWSIALRANDRRLTPLHTAIIPEKAPAHCEPHEVIVDKSLLHRLCHPIRTGAPHDLLTDIARRLGVQPSAVRAEVRRGTFRQDRVKGFEHKNDSWGGIPFVFSNIAFDPNYGNRRRGPDPVWGTWWHDLPHAVPDDFRQTLRRIPELHTESKLNPRRLKGPRHPDRRFEDPHFTPIDRFWGWRWLCPGCEQTCRLIFLPTPFPLPRCIEDYLAQHAPDALAPTPSSFACAKCHQLRGGLSWAANDAWNHVITLISGGLLFGHEVEIPKCLNRQRKFTTPKRPQNRPSPRREEVEVRLLKGWTYPQIGKDLGMSHKTVGYHVGAAKKFHQAKTRQQLFEKLRAASPRPSTKTG